MAPSRRSFIQFLAGGAGLLFLGWTALKALSARVFQAALPPRSVAPGNHRWVMVIDLAKCDGCKDCTKACNKMHFVPPFQEWIKVYEVSDNMAAGPYFLARPCMQCDNPPCVRGCPTGATFKRTDGIVIQDNDRCIGCRNCIAQCPYSARFFNWGEPKHTAEELAHPYSIEHNYPHRMGVVEKCIFCPDMLRAGKLPACAEACTMGAVYFGDELEDAVTNQKGETIQFSKVAKRGAAFRLLQELGTEPRVYYLPPAGRKYPAPDEKPHAMGSTA
ncbi:MAG: 4Fe-4S dicluster domain-containing protein [Acidobacteria bacterium]|nr:4Fe-4S dicluster domain-containing protein [Acidobacteriota bacterium]